MNCHSQYVSFIFSRMEHQLILLERCAGQMEFFLGNRMGAGDQLHGHKAPRSHTPRFFFLGSSDVTSVAYLAMYHLVTLEKISMLLIQTSHFKLYNVCVAVCSNVSTHASNRKAIDMNICFTSVFFMRLDC